MAIKPTDFYNHLTSHGIDFFAGVPDSLLKEFCLCIDDFVPKDKHIITANEGNAIALAAGYYLAKKSLPLVYMQNSGLGNAINPLLSLCDPDVYAIPMVVVVGWRGEPGVKDEPQHVKQGKVQLDLLDAMDISYEIISKDDAQVARKISKVVETAKNEYRPTVLLIKKGTFEKYGKENPEDKAIIYTRFGAIHVQLFNDTPLHRANFIRLAKMGYFETTFFHRIAENFVVQGGNSDNVATQKVRSKVGDYLIPSESDAGHLHNYGAFSAAKYSEQNISKASSPFEFFIVH